METWLLRLNMGKCKAISYSRRPELNTNYSISGVIVENIQNVKDLGVTFDHKLKFDKHINNEINTAYQMLGIVKRNFIYLTPDSFVLYKAMIRSQSLRICSQCVESSSIEKLERVRKWATKLVIKVKKLHYEERLRQLKIPTLKYRRIRGDMIELYKIFAGKYDNNTTEWIEENVLKNMIQEIIDLHYNSHMFIMICVNLIFLIGLSQYGIVYQIMLLLLLP